MKKSKTSTFLLELSLATDPGQAKRLRGHFEAARQLYNALLGEALKRMYCMRADSAWQAAHAISHTRKQERHAAFAQIRKEHGFSEYAMHAFAKEANCSWIADHLDAVTARIPAIINWNDPVVKHGLGQRIKYVRIVRRKASGPKARGADYQGTRYYVQLVLEGQSYLKKKNRPGEDVVGLDLGPSTIAIVPRKSKARLELLCNELKPSTRKKQQLERKMDRQRRANNPQNYDEKGRIKKQGKRRLSWKNSKGYLVTQRRHANQERILAAHRKSLHGRKVNDIVRIGNSIHLEKISYKGWQNGLGRASGSVPQGCL
jgi:hypothetical protein